MSRFSDFSKPLRFSIYFALSAMLWSCDKVGCLDPDAENYEPLAKKDCGCCSYYGKVYLWYKADFYENRELYNENRLFFYVDGVLAGQYLGYLDNFVSDKKPELTKVYTEYEPEKDFQVLLINMDSRRESESLLEVKLADGSSIFRGNINVLANNIIPVELTINQK